MHRRLRRELTILPRCALWLAQIIWSFPADALVLRVLAFTGIEDLIPRFADLNEALEHAHAVVPQPLQRHATSSADGDSLEVWLSRLGHRARPEQARSGLVIYPKPGRLTSRQTQHPL